MSEFFLSESFWRGVSAIQTGISLLIGCLLVVLCCSAITEEKKMKFRFLTACKRRLERVFDVGLTLLLVGIIMWHGGKAEDLRFFGVVLLSWCCLSWMLQKGWIPQSIWSHIGAPVVLIVWLYVFVILITM